MKKFECLDDNFVNYSTRPRVRGLKPLLWMLRARLRDEYVGRGRGGHKGGVAVAGLVEGLGRVVGRGVGQALVGVSRALHRRTARI